MIDEHGFQWDSFDKRYSDYLAWLKDFKLIIKRDHPIGSKDRQMAFNSFRQCVKNRKFNCIAGTIQRDGLYTDAGPYIDVVLRPKYNQRA